MRRKNLGKQLLKLLEIGPILYDRDAKSLAASCEDCRGPWAPLCEKHRFRLERDAYAQALQQVKRGLDELVGELLREGTRELELEPAIRERAWSEVVRLYDFEDREP